MSPVSRKRRHDQGFQTGAAHYYTGSQAMQSPISPPQKRYNHQTRPNGQAFGSSPTRSGGFSGTRSGFFPRVPQYDRKMVHQWPNGRSPPTRPRSMRPAGTGLADNDAVDLGAVFHSAQSDPGIQASERLGNSRVPPNNNLFQSPSATLFKTSLNGNDIAINISSRPEQGIPPSFMHVSHPTTNNKGQANVTDQGEGSRSPAQSTQSRIVTFGAPGIAPKPAVTDFCADLQPSHLNASGPGTALLTLQDQKSLEPKTEHTASQSLLGQVAQLRDRSSLLANGTHLLPDEQDAAESTNSTQKLDINNKEVCSEKPQSFPPEQPTKLGISSIEKAGHVTQSHRPDSKTSSAQGRGFSPAETTQAGTESSSTDGAVPLKNKTQKDTAVLLTLCTSCGTKRVFRTVRDGETDVLWYVSYRYPSKLPLTRSVQHV